MIHLHAIPNACAPTWQFPSFYKRSSLFLTKSGAPVPGAGDEGDAPGMGPMRSLHGLQSKGSGSQDDHILSTEQQPP